METVVTKNDEHREIPKTNLSLPSGRNAISSVASQPVLGAIWNAAPVIAAITSANGPAAKNLFIGVAKKQTLFVSICGSCTGNVTSLASYSIKLSISSRRSSATCRPVRYRDRASPDFSLTLTSTGSGGSNTSLCPLPPAQAVCALISATLGARSQRNFKYGYEE